MHELPEKIFKECCYEIFEQSANLWHTPSPGFKMILTFPDGAFLGKFKGVISAY